MNLMSLTDLHLQPNIIVACIAAAGAAFALLWLAIGALTDRHLHRRCETLAAGIESLRAELELANARAADSEALAAQRIAGLEAAQGRIVERLRFVERRSDGRSFDLAIDSARHGTEPQRLAADFGLSRGEAELVARMHGRAAAGT
jgi:hypothetical protein